MKPMMTNDHKGYSKYSSLQFCCDIFFFFLFLFYIAIFVLCFCNGPHSQVRPVDHALYSCHSLMHQL